jgi:hypothetical protein
VVLVECIQHKKCICIFRSMFLLRSKCIESTVYKVPKKLFFQNIFFGYLSSFYDVPINKSHGWNSLSNSRPYLSSWIEFSCSVLCLCVWNQSFLSFLNFKKQIRMFLSSRVDRCRGMCDLFYVSTFTPFSLKSKRKLDGENCKPGLQETAAETLINTNPTIHFAALHGGS